MNKEYLKKYIKMQIEILDRISTSFEKEKDEGSLIKSYGFACKVAQLSELLFDIERGRFDE